MSTPTSVEALTDRWSKMLRRDIVRGAIKSNGVRHVRRMVRRHRLRRLLPRWTHRYLGLAQPYTVAGYFHAPFIPLLTTNSIPLRCAVYRDGPDGVQFQTYTREKGAPLRGNDAVVFTMDEPKENL